MPTWDEIVDQHTARVYRLAYRLTGNPHDAEDLTQEVFVRVFRSLDTYTPGTFEGWLHRVTTNLFLDGARRKQRIRFDALSDERAARLRSSSPSPDMAYADMHFEDDVERALATLPPDFRAAVVLCDVEGLSYEEIAEILGAKLGTVRSRIHRGRAQLRSALAHRAPAEGRSRYSGPQHRPAARAGPVVNRLGGHLGDRVSALLDGQLAAEDEERAWDHVHLCHLCRDLVEREGWVKTRLAGLTWGSPAEVPSHLRGSLMGAPDLTARRGLPRRGRTRPPRATGRARRPRQRRRRCCRHGSARAGRRAGRHPQPGSPGAVHQRQLAGAAGHRRSEPPDVRSLIVRRYRPPVTMGG